MNPRVFDVDATTPAVRPVAWPLCPVCVVGSVEFFLAVGDLRYWRCPHCLATLLEPRQRLSLEDERAEYRLHRNDPADAGYRAFLARLAEPLLARLAQDSEGLDFGCGPGPALSAMLREAGHRMRDYDPAFAPDPAALARTYDFIACTEVFEHLHQPARELALLESLLRPGGMLAVMTNFQTDDARFADWKYRRDPTHVVFYRRHTFEVLAHARGWDCEFPAANVVFLTRAA